MESSPAPALVPVLCIYTYVESGSHARHGVRYRATKMVTVEHSDEIVRAFCRAMEEDRLSWNVWAMGNRRYDLELVGYLPANFQMTF